MPATVLPIANGFYVSPSLPISAQECTNFYPNINEVPALNQETLFGTAGLEQVASTGTVQNQNRGSHEMNGVPYFVNGTSFYSLVETIVNGVPVYTLTNYGTVAGTARVSMADNGTQLMILVPSGAGYIFTHTANTFVTITDVDFTANGLPQFVVFIDSYFVCSTDSKKFIRSNSNDGNNWNALNFYTAESDPDDIVGLEVYKNKLYVLGSEVTEEFYNNAGVFQRTGFFIDKGLYARFSTISTSDSFMWIGGGTNESPAIWTLNGNTPVKISNTAIEAALQKFSFEQIQQAFSYSYAQSGAYFVGFSLPTKTFEYNTVTGRWNERKSQIVNTKGVTETIRWRVNSLVTAYNRVLVGDSQDGRIGSVEIDTYTEYGSEIIRVFSTQPISSDSKVMIISQLEATLEAGVGNEDAEDPQIRMQISKDGKTFNDELSRSIGEVGQYQRRAIWRNLGRFPRMCVIRFIMSDPVKPVFLKLTANIRIGNGGN